MDTIKQSILCLLEENDEGIYGLDVLTHRLNTRRRSLRLGNAKQSSVAAYLRGLKDDGLINIDLGNNVLGAKVRYLYTITDKGHASVNQ